MRTYIKGWLSLALLVGCAGNEPAIEPEIDPACQDAAELLDYCRGGASDEFFAACEEDPTRAEDLVAAECPADLGKSDGWFGWREWGERCWFNWECVDDLECRPLGYEVPGDQACLEPGEELGRAYVGDWCGEWCDDDDDCVDGLLCREEGVLNNGMCVAPDREIEYYARCSVFFH